jgi:hypothetical protein
MQFIARSPSEVKVPSWFTSILHCSYNANWTCAHNGIQLNSCPGAVPEVLLVTNVVIVEIMANMKSFSLKDSPPPSRQGPVKCNIYAFIPKTTVR